MDETNKGARLSLNSLGSLFSDSFALYQERFVALSEIVLLPILVMLLSYALAFLGYPFSIVGLLVLIVGIIIFIVSSLALTFSTHHNVGADASYRSVMKMFWPYIWISILGSFALMGATALFIIPGIWLAIALVFKMYTLVIENRKGLSALQQSMDYVKGYWWPVLGRTILFAIFALILSIIVSLPLKMVGGQLGAQIGSLIIAFFVVPFGVVFFYKIYENLRALKPELHSATHKKATFLKVAGIIGIVALVLLVGLVAAGIINYTKDGGYMNGSYQYQYNGNWQYSPSSQ